MPELNPIKAPGPDSGRPDSGGVLTIRQVNIGQGNLTYIICPNGKRVLIDAGSHDQLPGDDLTPVANQLDYAFPDLPWSNFMNVLYVDLIILTHADKDHYNKISRLVAKASVQQMYIGGPLSGYNELAYKKWESVCLINSRVNPVTERYEQRIDQIIINGTPGHQTPLLLCDGTIPGQRACEIWALAGTVPPGAGDTVTNANSIVVKIIFGDTSAMITGDATAATENFIINNPGSDISLKSNILLVPHHGSESSSTPAFVEAVSPRTAIISAKNGNIFGLPRENIVKRYTDPPAMLNPLAADQTHQIATYIDLYTLSNPPMSTSKDIWQTGVSGTRSYRLDGVNVTPL